MMLNRTIQPEFQQIKDFVISDPTEIRLHNGNSLFRFTPSEIDVVKVDIIYNAGKWYQHKPLTSYIAARMFKEGCKSKNGEEIATFLDFHGAYFSVASSQHFTTFSLSCQGKHFEQVFSLIVDIIKNPTFPDEELTILLQNEKQVLLAEQEKVRYLAAAKMANVLYGTAHPYGSTPEIEDYDLLTSADLRQYFEENFVDQNCTIFLSGKDTPQIISLIDTHFGQITISPNQRNEPLHVLVDVPEKQFFIEKPAAIQTAMHVGKRTILKGHPDFFALYALNTIFGGYFNSRLMKSIREEKGFTYGISSYLSTSLKETSWVIHTEIATQYVDDTIAEIKVQMERLRTELVTNDEMDILRNFLAASAVRNFDGPFSYSENFKPLWEFGFDFDYQRQFSNFIYSLTPEIILQTAVKYLDPESFSFVIAGSKDK